jgi:hypothetical protein
MEKHSFSLNFDNEEINFDVIIDSVNYSAPYSVYIYENKDANEYIVYETDENGYIQIGMSFSDKEEAIKEAIGWKIDLFSSLPNNSNTKLIRKKDII